MKSICIYGSSSNEIDPQYMQAVETLGRQMVGRGFGLVFGGGAQGLMGAAARGVHASGGYILGVAPDFFDVDGVLFQECSDFIYTKTMRERKRIMEDSADAFVVAPGGFGTFEEFFEILTLKQLQQHNKPIVILNVGGYYDALLQFIEKSIEQNFVKEACRRLYFVSDDPIAALDYIEGYHEEAISVKQMRDVKNEYTHDRTR